ncbi:MAG: MATE family efflux transporter [Lachnospiraceae bacterium]|nr:MATE family efflux transporter [Lachnospiraceae bacterium]
MDTNTFMFEKMQPTKLFIKCAIPATLSMIFSGIYSIADGIFVGRCIGADALAAVNLVMPLIMISFALAEMIAVGSSVQIAMLLGQKEKELADRTFSVCIKVILGISVIIGLIFFFLSKPILMLMGTEGMALQYSIEYIRVYAVFSPLIIVYFAADNYLRICGKQNYSMALNIATSVLNIVLDFLLLVVWKQGVWAAAFTSCISMALGTVMALCPFFRNKLELKFVKGWISAKHFVKLVANGSSEFFANIASSIFSFILNIVLLSIGGATAVAAMSVVMYVESIASMMISGMSDSMQPAISYCHGAGLKKRVYALEKRVLVSAAVLSLTACLLLRYGGAWVVPFFVKPGETELLTLSIHAMSLYALSYLVNWVDGCLSGYLTALGQAGRSFIVSIMGTLVLPLVGLAVLAPPLGLAGVCLMPLFAGVLSAVLSLVLVLTIKNKSV